MYTQNEAKKINAERRARIAKRPLMQYVRSNPKAMYSTTVNKQGIQGGYTK